MADSVPRDYTPLARRLLTTALVLAGLAAAGWWAWQQPFMASTRMTWEISRMPAPVSLPMPVDGVAVGAVADTWGAARDTDRRHEGVDIFAERGTAVASTTRGVISAVREGGLGGRQVWVLGPGMERHYYAHLDGWAAGLSKGGVVLPGDLLGFVGDSGNARGTPTHLHYGIYGDGGALDPLPRLRAGADDLPVEDTPAETASR
ncbi:peptidoglycan DD-metalloendopeptidase family protein [Lysobacter sp. F6437]|uniref:peptidoglycan DD-metalloendopeptidase family protein n=1 Tax=Lysobacter sp. F6437 TaxID=3459296 RepID=UPI00403D8797